MQSNNSILLSLFFLKVYGFLLLKIDQSKIEQKINVTLVEKKVEHYKVLNEKKVASNSHKKSEGEMIYYRL